MTESKNKNPQSSAEMVDMYFLENRAKLIDIAAFLDRLERASDTDASDDFRIKAFAKAAAVITDGAPDKAKRILEIFSDYTPDIPESAPQSKGASGAPKEVAK